METKDKIFVYDEEKVLLPPTTKKFVVKSKFLINLSKRTKVKISHMSGEFRTNFLPDTLGLVESERRHTLILYSGVIQSELTHFEILKELTGSEFGNATFLVPMSAIYDLMCRQANGELGSLLTNGSANMFFVSRVEGYNNALFSVRLRWEYGGWSLKGGDSVAHEVFDPNPFKWQRGTKIFWPHYS